MTDETNEKIIAWINMYRPRITWAGNVYVVAYGIRNTPTLQNPSSGVRSIMGAAPTLQEAVLQIACTESLNKPLPDPVSTNPERARILLNWVNKTHWDYVYTKIHCSAWWGGADAAYVEFGPGDHFGECVMCGIRELEKKDWTELGVG